jgi:hypothetical protein
MASKSVNLHPGRYHKYWELFQGEFDSTRTPRPNHQDELSLNEEEVANKLVASSKFTWSGRPDSNWRPPRPERGALTRLRYAPTFYLIIKFLKNVSVISTSASRPRRANQAALLPEVTESTLLIVSGNQLSLKMKL